LCPFFNPNIERKILMTNHDIVNQTPVATKAPTDVALRQQWAATPDSGGRSAAHCQSGQFAEAAIAITTPPVRILRLPEVSARIGLKRASIYQHIAAGTFPKQISLGVRAVGWLESEINAWLTVRIQERHIPKP
jgi:prophage regulatory protein